MQGTFFHSNVLLLFLQFFSITNDHIILAEFFPQDFVFLTIKG